MALEKKGSTRGRAFCILGVGLVAAVAVIAILYFPFFKPLSSPESERLARFWQATEEKGRDFSSNELARLERAEVSFETVAGISFLRRRLRDSEGADPKPTTATVGRISPDYFRVFRIEPTLGRAFTEEELRDGAPVVILGDRFWASRYGGDPETVGRRVTMVGREYTIVGIAEDAMRTPSRASVWRPFQPGETADWNQMIVVGRLRRGISWDRASEELRLVAATNPTERPLGVELQPLGAARADHGRRSVLLLSMMCLIVVSAIGWTTRLENTRRSVPTKL